MKRMEKGGPVRAMSLSSQIYAHLRHQLMSAKLQPGQRIKIRELAASLGTSETPAREALFQLVKDGALEMKSGYYIRVRRLSLAEYVELRDIRLVLEPYAAVQALHNVDEALIQRLEGLHRSLIEAEGEKEYASALQHNYDFHFTLYRRSGMEQLTEILERLWIQVGPLLNFLYPHGHPTYSGMHQHLNILAALRQGDEGALGEAIRQDLIEGGRMFLEHLTRLEASDEKGEDTLTHSA